MDTKQLDALISLLDDNDREVFQHVTEQLISLGTPVIPRLENAWEHSLDPDLQERLEQVIHRIQLKYTIAEFAEWLNEPDHKLIDGALIIAKYHYPELDVLEQKRKLDIIRREIWVELNDYLSPLEQVNVFNQIFYKIENFSGTNSDSSEPSGYYVNLVLDSKKGNHLSLGVLYKSLAEQLSLPIYGVDLPHHFCMAYLKHETEKYGPEMEKEVIFYINPLNNGLIFTKNEIREYLAKLSIPEQQQHFLPISNKEIIRLLIKGLRDAYQAANQPEKYEELGKFLDIMDGSAL